MADTVKFTQNLKEATSDYTDTTVVVGQQYTVTLTATNGVFKNDINIIYYDDIGSPATLATAKATNTNTISITFTPIEGDDLELDAEAKPAIDTIGFYSPLQKCSFDQSKMTYDVSNGSIPETIVHIALKADAGFAFNDDGSITYTDQDYNQTTDPVKANQQSNIEFDIDNSPAKGYSSIELDFTATPQKVTEPDPTYTETLENCTSDYKAITISKASHTINFKASDGYIFSNDGQVLSGTNVVATISKTGTDTTSVTFTPTGTAITVKLSAVAKPDPNAIPLVLNIKNVASEYNQPTVIKGKSYDFKLNGRSLDDTSSDLGTIINNGTIDIATNDGKHTIKVIDSESISYIEVAFSVPVTAVSVTVNYEAYKKVAGYLSVNYQNLTNCTVTFDGLDEQTAKQETSNTFTFKASKNCVFSKQGTITTSDDIAKPINNAIEPTNTDTVTISLDTSKLDTIELNLEATNTSSENTGGYVNIYSPTLNEVNELSNEALWGNDNGDTSNVNKNEYINIFYRLPFHLTGLNTSTSVPFLLGIYKSVKSTTTQINQDTVDVNIGTISVPFKYNNSYDYLNTKCTLYLPFVKSMPININDVIGSSISINYIIDLFTGNTTVNILDAKGTTLTTSTFKLSTDLPLIDVTTNNIKMELNNTYENNITQAFLIVTRNKPVTNALSYPTLEQGKLINYNGYIKCSEIFINNSTIDNNELSEITDQLQKGVTIKWVT